MIRTHSESGFVSVTSLRTGSKVIIYNNKCVTSLQRGSRFKHRVWPLTFVGGNNAYKVANLYYWNYTLRSRAHSNCYSLRSYELPIWIHRTWSPLFLPANTSCKSCILAPCIWKLPLVSSVRYVWISSGTRIVEDLVAAYMHWWMSHFEMHFSAVRLSDSVEDFSLLATLIHCCSYHSRWRSKE